MKLCVPTVLSSLVMALGLAYSQFLAEVVLAIIAVLVLVKIFTGLMSGANS